MFDLIPDLSLRFKALAALVTVVIAGSVLRTKLKGRRRLPLPPGPPRHWLFGNTIPKENQSQQFAEWINQYGPVVSLRFGSNDMVIIGRLKESVEIMEREGSLLGDRPRYVIAGEILSHGMRMILAPAGERFRKLRKAAHTHLQPKAVESYVSMQMQAASDVVLDILRDPKHLLAHANRYAASLILRITYGKSTPTETNAPEILTIHRMLKRFQIVMRPGIRLAEKYPILKHIPGYASDVHAWHREEFNLFCEQLNRVAAEMKSGEAGPSFVRHLLENQDSHKLSYKEMAYLGGTMFGAGSDTTAVAIMDILMAAACHPEAQSVIQDELDNVVGRERAPIPSDFSALPQLQAFVFECWRWRPVTTLGFSHRATSDIYYNGWCIPEGTIVLGNHWAISRDPEAYPDPEKFDPQRWITSDGRLRDDNRFPAFGFGRRICPGQHIATRSIMLNAALLLWSFRITEDPKAPITPTFTDGVVAHPDHFDACFTPRIGDEAHLREAMAKYAQGI